MKKLALTSLVAVFAVSGANAANIINNNPLYRPNAGHFYSITGLSSETKPLMSENGTKEIKLTEEFAYGFTDRFMVGVKTSVTQSDWFDTGKWNDVTLAMNYRLVDMGAWKADVFGAYGVNDVWGWGDNHPGFLDEKDTNYTWTVGVNAGYATSAWTIAGHVAFDYNNTESFNWGDSFDKGIRTSSHKLRLGLDGQLVLNQDWNLTAGVEYNADYDYWSQNEGYWTGTVGANYNIDETKFVGAYITKYMTHEAAGDWEVQDGFGYGVKFGIDF